MPSLSTPSASPGSVTCSKGAAWRTGVTPAAEGAPRYTSWAVSPRRILFLPHLGHLPARLPPTPVWSLHSRHSATLRTDLAHYLVLTGDGWHRVEPPPTSHCVKLSKLWGRFNLCMVGWVVEVSGGVQIVVDFVLLSYEFNF
ncbi:hypothetical protein BC938DRAFT_474387 [Jimgerdemannia flammicorona]|uniref:Uncharacterized protein n=1 Tax=Jimgerdemannia flammicorona TaxID=994334 RepID=A0A433Q2C9_9FUNG|nr:hypothetical protein BC938DRAFT_474387 [Jimgerdemannia flammicorona]